MQICEISFLALTDALSRHAASRKSRWIQKSLGFWTAVQRGVWITGQVLGKQKERELLWEYTQARVGRLSRDDACRYGEVEGED